VRVSVPALFLGYLVAEGLLLFWFWSAFGTVAVVSLLVAGFLFGLLVMRIAGMSAFGALTDAQQRAAAFGVTAPDGSEQVVHGTGPSRADVEEAAHNVGTSSLLFVAGLLIMMPGILSDVVGLVLLLPVTRDRLARRMGRSMQQRSTITVVTADEAGFTARQYGGGAPAPSQNPERPVIRGEILPPKQDGDQ